MSHQEPPPMDAQRKLSGSTESSENTTSGGSLFENSGTLSSGEESSLSSPVSPKRYTNLNIAVFAGIRPEPIEDLTGRVRVSSALPLFEGGYSYVWNGTLDNTQFVAIKCPKNLQNIKPEKAQRRFKREAGTWWCLLHENVIPLLGVVEGDTFGTFGAMVSPWYKNGSATAYLSNPKRPVPIAGRFDLFYGVAKGIHYLHTFDTTKIIEEFATGSEDESENCGTVIIHGDLKPPNILVDDNGVPKLCDFGLVRLARDSSHTGLTTTSHHTGTTRYLCYELVVEDENQGADFQCVPTTASDVHALASVGFEFLYSTQPYANIPNQRRVDLKIGRAIERKEPPATRPKDISGVVSTLWDMLEQCWKIDPRERLDAHAICEYLHKNREDLIADME